MTEKTPLTQLETAMVNGLIQSLGFSFAEAEQATRIFRTRTLPEVEAELQKYKDQGMSQADAVRAASNAEVARLAAEEKE